MILVVVNAARQRRECPLYLNDEREDVGNSGEKPQEIVGHRKLMDCGRFGFENYKEMEFSVIDSGTGHFLLLLGRIKANETSPLSFSDGSVCDPRC